MHPNLIYTVYNALSDIFSNFSKDSSNLKESINKAVKDLSKTMCFVSNQNNNIIIQASSADFDASTLYYLYDFVYRASQSSENNITNQKFINAGSKLLYMQGEDISKFHSDFKNVIFFSETLEENDLANLINNVKEHFG